MTTRLTLLAALALPVLLTAMVRAQPAQAHTTVYVRTAASFQSAVAQLRNTGGTIVLTGGIYGTELHVGPRSSRLLDIVGTSGARVRSILLDHTRNVRIRRLAIRAMTSDGGIHAAYSQDLTFSRLSFSARSTRHIVQLNLDHSSHVRVQDSRFTHCGDNTTRWSMCILPRWASSVTIKGNWFHDCYGCDFIHGRAGAHLTITRNRFVRALACPHSWYKCGHQDMIELFAADGMLVSRNVFGVNERGGAQLYLALETDHVRVVNNLFLRDDPEAPTVEPHVGILVGTKFSTRVPHDVTIVNNTILSGFPKADHDAQSIVLSPHYVNDVAPRNRPVIANNILARQLEPRLVCPRVRVSSHNVVEQGTACRPTDAVGDPLLNARFRPTASSALVIDMADPTLAPLHDLLGHRRIPPPDIGAYEYRGN
jgi:hypothetical protein